MDKAIHWKNHNPMDKCSQSKPKKKVIPWIVIYWVDSVIHLSNNLSLICETENRLAVINPLSYLFEVNMSRALCSDETAN